MLRDIADCSVHIRFEMAFTAKQMEKISAVGDNWDELWETMSNEHLKPIALRAVQGHNHRVDEHTPYEDRFDEVNARGDSSDYKVKTQLRWWQQILRGPFHQKRDQ